MRWLNWIGALTYDVMATHVPIKCGAAALVAWIFSTTVGETSTNIWLAAATFIVTLPVVMLAIWLIDKLRQRNKA